MPFAEVAVYARRPTHQTFTYAIPGDLPVRPGDGVFVPFGRRVLQGIVMAISDHTSIYQPRPIHGRIQDQPLLTRPQVRVAIWIAEHYLAPIFSAVALFLPPGFERFPKPRLYAVVTPATEALAALPTLSAPQRSLLAAVGARDGVYSDAVAALAPEMDAAVVARTLVEQGLLEERQTALPQPRSAVRTRSVLSLSLEPPAMVAVLAAWPQSRPFPACRSPGAPAGRADDRRGGPPNRPRGLGSMVGVQCAHAARCRCTAIDRSTTDGSRRY